MRVWRDNGLSITLLILFLVFLAGQVLTGQVEYNEQRQRGSPESKPVDAPHSETGGS
jgi:hypothetical protein